jgi:hypothetical protein
MCARTLLVTFTAGLALAAVARDARAQASLAGETIHISRAKGPIAIDGDLSDEGWKGATRVEKFYEISPGDNIEPKVKTVGYLTYDDRFFYVAFELSDPDPKGIRAPYGDHDSLNGNSDDAAGIFLDSMNTERTAAEFFVTARNVQYDAITDDTSNENSSPDFFWDSATKITATGWVVEMRIPFTSLRFKNADPQTWGILLWRNYPHGFRQQIVSAKFPRGGNCTVCRINKLEGLEHLPSGGHLVAAPYVSASQTAEPENGVLGAPLAGEGVKPRVGLDFKYTPTANDAVDLTVKPDFSQVEADTAQISANERFALFFPEKRPFFLEGVDLFQTPINAVYTRTITSPLWGGRVTGKAGGLRYTALVSEDEGGGTAIIPGPNGSSFAAQDFGSTVFLARAKEDIGLSSVGALITDRENRDGQGHNRVAGPDFNWRLSPSDVVSGQALFSESKTPNQPDVTPEWNGQTLSGYASRVQWNHNTRHLDWYGQYNDASAGFRADSGFVPQVDFREYFGGGGWQIYPKGFISRERTFINADYYYDRAGNLISRDVFPGLGFDTRFNGFVQLRYHDGAFRAGDVVIPRKQFGYVVQFSPSRYLSYIGINGNLGQDVDFENARPGNGPTLNASATVHPTNHLELALIEDYRALSVDDAAGVNRQLFSQTVSRVKGTYTFTSRMFTRVIAQYVSTNRDPSLYIDAVAPHSGTFGGSLLFAYKLNWQSVAFIGYGDDRTLSDVDRLEKQDRQFFIKFSYAFQR